MWYNYTILLNPCNNKVDKIKILWYYYTILRKGIIKNMPKEKTKETVTVVIDLDILDYINTEAKKTGNKSTVVNNMLRGYINNVSGYTFMETFNKVQEIGVNMIKEYEKTQSKTVITTDYLKQLKEELKDPVNKIGRIYDEISRAIIEKEYK